MAKVIEFQKYKRNPRKRTAATGVVDAIRIAAAGGVEACNKACHAAFNREALIAVPRSIFDALVADSRALADVRRELVRHDPWAAELLQDPSHILADAAEWAEQWAVRLPRRRALA